MKTLLKPDVDIELLKLNLFTSIKDQWMNLNWKGRSVDNC